MEWLSVADRPRSSLSDKLKERRLKNHDDVEMNKHAVEGGRWRRIGDDNHDANEARTCKGNKPHDAGAMANFSTTTTTTTTTMTTNYKRMITLLINLYINK